MGHSAREGGMRRKKLTTPIPPAKEATPIAPDLLPESAALKGQIRVLIVSSRLDGERLRASLAGLAEWCEVVTSLKAAHEAVASAGVDVVLVAAELPDGSGLSLVEDLSNRVPGVACIVLARGSSLDEAVSAMRAGAVDFLHTTAGVHELVTRVRAASQRARLVQAREKMLDRLKKTCTTLDSARVEVSKQVSSLCNDLVDAYRELSEQMTQVTIAGEFSAQIRMELDVESLLRTALEYILVKTGPTNGAVFLPSTSRDFSLGAYVNYDCPKDTADMLLENLANTAAPRMEHEERILLLENDRDVREFLGEHAHWLEGNDVLVFSCRHEQECLAVILLFRERARPFPESLLLTLRTIADAFGRQLSRVIHVHHRHLPKEQWGAFGEPDDDSDDYGLAA